MRKLTPLNMKLEHVKWSEFKLGDLFDIQKTTSFDSDELTDGDAYDYVTRTSNNQGILRKTGFVNQSNINKAGGWSLGLLQMDFFIVKDHGMPGNLSDISFQKLN